MFAGASTAFRLAGGGQLADGAELPAVLLRPAGLGGRNLDADGRPVVFGAAPDRQRDGPRAGHRGPLSAHVRVRPARRIGGRPAQQAAGPVRHPDPLRAVGRRLCLLDRHRRHRDVDGLPAGAGAGLRQRLRQSGPAKLHRRAGPPGGAVQRGHLELGVAQYGPGLRCRPGRGVRRRPGAGHLLRPQRRVVSGGPGLAGPHAPRRSAPEPAGSRRKRDRCGRDCGTCGGPPS